jgi:phenylacetate-CoA ligase
MPYYLKNLNKYKPEVITGFVSAIHEISQFVNRKKIRLAFTPKAVFTTSETLFPHHREAIEKAFGCKVYNQYASAEGAPFITECSEGNLHYNLDTGVIESNDNNEMIVTSFTTHGTPLVRYNIGDIIKWKEGACNCGSCHPLVESIEGRNVDYLVRQDGRKISLSHLADVIKGIPNSITKMQFIQENEDTIVVKIETDKLLFNVEHQEKMMIELRYRFGDEMNIEIREVTNIPKQKSGKYALIKNRIK